MNPYLLTSVTFTHVEFFNGEDPFPCNIQNQSFNLVSNFHNHYGHEKRKYDTYNSNNAVNDYFHLEQHSLYHDQYNPETLKKSNIISTVQLLIKDHTYF